jgi:sulfane dehydrogenase subunit SoxC
MNSKMADRRGFLKGSAALAGLAVGAIPFVNGKARAADMPDDPTIEDLSYGARSRYETVNRVHSVGVLNVTGLRNLTPLQDTIGAITPAALHFLVLREQHLPNINPEEHSLIIHGMVDRPLIFTMKELKRFPSVSAVHFLECTGNSGLMHYKSYMKDLKNDPELSKTVHLIQALHGRTSCNEWTGVRLSVLLKEAGVKKGASWIVAEGGDTEKHAKSMPLEKCLDDVIVAYGQNGEALRREQGYPLRLLVPGWQGVNNVKYLRNIKVVDKAYYFQSETTAYTNLRPDGKASIYESQVGPKSLITFPCDAHHLTERGYYEISGLAWCGRGAISRVEVSTNSGRTWKDATLQQPVYRKAHTRFRFDWNWDGSETVIMSRCTNEYGDIQPTMLELAQLWGDNREPHLSGEVIERFWETANISEFLNNPIQLWKIGQDGSVKDALYNTFNIKV